MILFREGREEMRCQYCNSSWESSQSINKCPFCGKDFASEPQSFSDIQPALNYVVSKYGKEVYNTEKRCLSILSDYTHGLEKEIRLLRLCFESGVVSDILAADEKTFSEQKIIVQKASAKLEDQYFIKQDNAVSVLLWITGSLGWAQEEGLLLKSNTAATKDVKKTAPKESKRISEIKTTETKSQKTTHTYKPQIKHQSKYQPKQKNTGEKKKHFTAQTVRSLWQNAENIPDPFVIPQKYQIIENDILALVAKDFRIKVDKIEIPDSVEQIGEDSFAGFKIGKSITIPDSVKSIGQAAFFLSENAYAICSKDSFAYHYCREHGFLTLPDLITKRQEQCLCQYCGGNFKFSLFKKKCSVCGKEKDY